MAGKRSRPYISDVLTDDDIARMVHETSAVPSRSLRWQSDEEPFGLCGGSAWSAALVAEAWHEIFPVYPAEMEPVQGQLRGSAARYLNGSLSESGSGTFSEPDARSADVRPGGPRKFPSLPR